MPRRGSCCPAASDSIGDGMQTRRTFLSAAALAASGASALATVKASKNFKGVIIGVQTYSLRDRDVTAAIKALRELKVDTVELFSGHVEPFKGRPDREEVRQWRPKTPMTYFTRLRQQFNCGRIPIHPSNYSFR